ncbi:transcriptional regulator, RpiR family [Alkalibacterium putridalgicola]|uniref:Phosphosugar-binding protein n=1 Tax=Alkalibacterium putridalgicola TaxID=426703 RepID=A0A1H7TEC5_9LACT|nr:MurR/RpiR family transcriptional regulator [Alkalibacterium putridalgicola]GEK89435.1 phosphosugar-binding protein [Alkalibacterium putridalgicola]SEL83083.1 transcriptional regulator, RpiR family [Alkalibacterium putridalgicola]
MGRLLDIHANELANLTYTEKQILYYIENNSEDVAEMSLTKLAEKNAVSTTTIVRLSHKLGYGGFSEFKFNLKKMNEQLTRSENLENLDPVDQYLDGLSTGLAHLDKNVLKKAAEEMKKADKIIIISVGLTKVVGEYMSKRLMQINRASSYIYESHMIDLVSNWVDSHDLVIFISSSGETQTLVKAAEKLSHLAIPTIVLTNNPDSALMKTTDIGVSFSIQHYLYKGYDISARSFLVILSDLVVDYYRMIEYE